MTPSSVIFHPWVACMIAGWGLHSGVEGQEKRNATNRKQFTESKLALIRSYTKEECECAFGKQKMMLTVVKIM